MGLGHSRESLKSDDNDRRNLISVDAFPVDTKWTWFDDIEVETADNVFVPLHPPSLKAGPVLTAGTDYPSVRLLSGVLKADRRVGL